MIADRQTHTQTLRQTRSSQYYYTPLPYRERSNNRSIRNVPLSQRDLRLNIDSARVSLTVARREIYVDRSRRGLIGETVTPHPANGRHVVLLLYSKRTVMINILDHHNTAEQQRHSCPIGRIEDVS